MRTDWSSNMKRTRVGILLTIALALAPLIAYAGSTVILSSTVYGGMSQVKTNVVPIALPGPGVYVFDLVADSTNSVAFSGLQFYLQQEGLSRGSFYTIPNSTFTACSAECGYTVYPDLYIGGRVRAQYSITSGSATVRITAREVNP